MREVAVRRETVGIAAAISGSSAPFDDEESGWLRSLAQVACSICQVGR